MVLDLLMEPAVSLRRGGPEDSTAQSLGELMRRISDLQFQLFGWTSRWVTSSQTFGSHLVAR